jgi:hypothetical protein
MGERCPCSFHRSFFCVVRLRLAPSPSPSFPGGQRALWWALGERRTETPLTDVTCAFCTTRRTKRFNAGVPAPAFGGPPTGEAISGAGDEQMGEIGGGAPAGGAAEPAGGRAELKKQRLRAAKLHVYAGQLATPGDGFSAKFTMQFCAVAAGLDGSAREVQNCYNSENHVKEQVDIGLDLGLDVWVKEQWDQARRRYSPKATVAKLRAAAKGYLAGAVGYDTHVAAAKSVGLDVEAKRGHVSADVQRLKRMLSEWDSGDDYHNLSDGDDDDDDGDDDDGGDGGDGDGGGAAAAGGDVTRDVGGGRRGKCGRKALVRGEHPPVVPYGYHGVAKAAYDNYVVEAAREIASYPAGKRWARAGELSEELQEEHGCIVGQKTLYNYSKKSDVVPGTPGGQYFSSSITPTACCRTTRRP